MSFVTGTAVELLYASTAAGTAQSGFTTELCLNAGSGAMGVQAHIPPDFWLPNSAQVGRGIRIVARGILSTNTLASPTYTFTVRGALAGNITTAPVLLGTTAAVSCVVSAANAIWELQGDVILKTMGAAGGNTTLTGVGTVSCGAFATATTAGAYIQPVYGASASPGTVATLDTSVANYININVACAANAVANTITLQQLLVYGLN